jgi:hypothetical protein
LRGCQPLHTSRSRSATSIDVRVSNAR